MGVGTSDLERFIGIITFDVSHSPNERKAQVFEAAIRGISRIEIEPERLGLIDLTLSLESIGEASVCLSYEGDIVRWYLQFEISHIFHLPDHISQIALKQSLKTRR